MAQNNIHLSWDWVRYKKPEDQVALMADALEAKGYQVNREVSNYRILMFRKDNTQWSQVYKRDRGLGYITVHGPEKEAATKDFHINATNKKQAELAANQIINTTIQRARGGV